MILQDFVNKFLKEKCFRGHLRGNSPKTFVTLSGFWPLRNKRTGPVDIRRHFNAYFRDVISTPTSFQCLRRLMEVETTSCVFYGQLYLITFHRSTFSKLEKQYKTGLNFSSNLSWYSIQLDIVLKEQGREWI